MEASLEASARRVSPLSVTRGIFKSSIVVSRYDGSYRYTIRGQVMPKRTRKCNNRGETLKHDAGCGLAFVDVCLSIHVRTLSSRVFCKAMAVSRRFRRIRPAGNRHLAFASGTRRSPDPKVPPGFLVQKVILRRSSLIITHLYAFVGISGDRTRCRSCNGAKRTEKPTAFTVELNLTLYLNLKVLRND